MDYTDLYEKLYDLGYHGDGTNIGVTEAFGIQFRYKFDSILDAGCSQGAAVADYLRWKKDAWGFDISPRAIEMAKDAGLGDRCIVGSLLDIPYSKKSFDALVSTDVLEHLDPADIDLAISEMFRVTKTYLFLRISKSIEGRKDWLVKLKEVHPDQFDDIENLHLSVFPLQHWIERIVAKGAMLIKKKDKLLIFKIT